MTTHFWVTVCLACFLFGCFLGMDAPQIQNEDCEHSFIPVKYYTEHTFFGTRTYVISRCTKCGKLKKRLYLDRDPIIKICARCSKITCFCSCNFGWYRWQAVYDDVFELVRDQFFRLLNLR